MKYTSKRWLDVFISGFHQTISVSARIYGFLFGKSSLMSLAKVLWSAWTHIEHPYADK